jgi:hypothetical protein
VRNNADPVRQLCADIATEKDSQKVQDLLRLLQAVILAKQYATAISERKRTNQSDPLARTTMH